MLPKWGCSAHRRGEAGSRPADAEDLESSVCAGRVSRSTAGSMSHRYCLTSAPRTGTSRSCGGGMDACPGGVHTSGRAPLLRVTLPGLGVRWSLCCFEEISPHARKPVDCQPPCWRAYTLRKPVRPRAGHAASHGLAEGNQGQGSTQQHIIFSDTFGLSHAGPGIKNESLKTVLSLSLGEYQPL